jgi:hypothetical protein
VNYLLAATVRRYQLVLATDNVNGFRAAGFKVISPFAQPARTDGVLRASLYSGQSWLSE